MKILTFLDERFLTKDLLKKLLILLLVSVAAFLMFFARYTITGSYRFFFLNWNLILAWIPVLLVLLKDTIIIKREIKLFAIFLSFLFLPNSFYVLTDFIHAQPSGEIGLWVDVILIAFYALNALLIGFVLVESFWRVIVRKYGSIKAIVVITLFFVLMSFGVYLGRFIRLNSWDIVDPLNMFDDIITGLSSTFDFIRALLFTVLYTVLLESIFMVIKRDEV